MGSRFCQKKCKISGEYRFTARRAHLLVSNAVNFCAVFSGEKFFHCIHRISYKKETAVHGFEPLASCMSSTFYSTAPYVTHFNDIPCQLKISVELVVNICKICDFSGEHFLRCILLVAVKKFSHCLSGNKI